jgi:hypothetical protein
LSLFLFLSLFVTRTYMIFFFFLFFHCLVFVDHILLIIPYKSSVGIEFAIATLRVTIGKLCSLVFVVVITTISCSFEYLSPLSLSLSISIYHHNSI